MSQAIAKYAAKKMFSSDMNKYRSKETEGSYDPYFQEIPHPRKPGKTKKVKKQIPSYIPAHDAEILARARKTAYRLDFSLFNLFGLRFGWSSVIGLVPVVGDGADGALALLLIRKMQKVDGGLPSRILIMMFINLVIDVLVGLVPFVGDLADAAIKCNGKNVRLLEEHLDKKYKPRDMEERDSKLPKDARPQPATAFEDFSDEETDQRNETLDNRRGEIRQPIHANSGRRERIPDEEMGVVHDRTTQNQPSRNNTKSSRR